MASRSTLVSAPAWMESTSARRSADLSSRAKRASARERRASASAGFFCTAASSFSIDSCDEPARVSRSARRAVRSRLSFRSLPMRLELADRGGEVAPLQGAVEVDLGLGVDRADARRHAVGRGPVAVLVGEVQQILERVGVVGEALRREA